MKILLISDLPPCKDYSGPLLTHELCGYLPDNSVYAFIVKNRALEISISPELKFAGKYEYIKPFENSLHLKFGNNPLINFIHQSFHNYHTIKILYKQVARVIRENKIDKIWIILQGQTMINLARYIIEHCDISVYSQVWDDPKWWLIDNQINKLSSKLILKSFNFVIKNSAACGVASENMAEEYAKKYGVSCYTLIPTLDAGLLTNNIKIFDEKKTLIGMCGQLYAIEEWECLIKAFNSINWILDGKEIIIHYIGYSLHNNSNPHIVNHGYKTQEKLLKILSQCDIQYCPYIINEKFKDVSKYSFPSKVITYLASNRPIFYHGPSYSSAAKLINKNNIGVVCNSLTTDAIFDGIRFLISSKETYEQMQKNIQQVNLNEFTPVKLKNKFLNMFHTKNKLSSRHPIVSIIIPVFNGANYLKEAIDSALAQTYENVEIIVINDGSNDNGATEQIARSYGNKICYLSKPNGGVATALNLGIRHMSGDYFSWLSHDDVYYPEKIEKQVSQVLKLGAEVILYSNYEVIDDKSNHLFFHNINSKFFNSKPLYSILRCAIQGCSLLIPRKVFDEFGDFDESLWTTQDYDMWFRIRQKYRFWHMPEILIKSRSHESQGSRSNPLFLKEGNELWVKFADSLTDDEILSCEKTKSTFFRKSAQFLSNTPYEEARNYYLSKIGKNSMQILQIGDNDLVGSRFNGHDLHIHLNERDHDAAHIVWNKKSYDSETFQLAENYPDRFTINARACEFNNMYSTQALFNPFSYELFSNELFLNSDVVHCHLVHNNFFNITHFPVLSALKPMVWTLHDPWAITGHCVYPSGCERWQIGCGKCPDLNLHFAIKEDTSALNWEIKKIAYQSSVMDIIVASQHMMDMVNKSPLLAHTRKHLVPFGLDMEKFCPRNMNTAKKSLGIDDDEIVLCFRNVGSQYKGIDYIHELLNRLNCDEKICLLTFNDVGNLDHYKSKYKVIELGWVLDEEQIINAYNATDIFLMPSKDEAFGMMAMEVMACAKPLVVMSGTSLEEIVYPQLAGGVVVAQGDILSFCNAVEKLIKSKEEREIIGKSVRKIAEEKYNLKRYINDILKVYQTAIREHNQDEKLLSRVKKGL